MTTQVIICKGNTPVLYKNVENYLQFFSFVRSVLKVSPDLKIRRFTKIGGNNNVI